MSRPKTNTIDHANTNDLLASILKVAQDAIITINDSSVIIVFNKGAEQVFGFAAAEVLGKRVDVVLPDTITGSPIENSDTETGLSLTGCRRDGTKFPIEASVTETNFQGQIYITAIVRDLTKRNKRVAKIDQEHKELKAYRKTKKQQLLREVQTFAASGDFFIQRM